MNGREKWGEGNVCKLAIHFHINLVISVLICTFAISDFNFSTKTCCNILFCTHLTLICSLYILQIYIQYALIVCFKVTCAPCLGYDAAVCIVSFVQMKKANRYFKNIYPAVENSGWPSQIVTPEEKERHDNWRKSHTWKRVNIENLAGLKIFLRKWRGKTLRLCLGMLAQEFWDLKTTNHKGALIPHLWYKEIKDFQLLQCSTQHMK